MPKIFIVSLHRTATRSTHELFVQSGLRAIHWPAKYDGFDFQSQAVGREMDAPHIAATLKPVIQAHDALSDVPFCGIYESIAGLYPESLFLALSRPEHDWIRSVRKHIGTRKLDAYEKTVYWRYLDSKPECLVDMSDEALGEMHRRHHESLRTFFKKSGQFTMIDMRDPQAGEKICAFASLPSRALPYITNPKAP